MPAGEPPEWEGRGRPGFYPSRPGGPPRSHRDTGEQPAYRTNPRMELPAAPARVEYPPPPVMLDMPPDPVARFGLWLGIFRDVLAILALGIGLYFGGFAIMHGGWPIWIPQG